MCGFIGILNVSSAVKDIYDGLIAIQHRGQDAAGILTCDAKGAFHLHKDGGLVRDIFHAKHVERLQGTMGIGHVRYPTVGAGGPEDAQPFASPHPFGIAMAHNGNVTNYDGVATELREGDHVQIESSCDLEVILHVFATALERRTREGFSVEAYQQAVAEVFDRVKGAYSVVGLIAGHGLFAFRDPFGIKPIVMARRPADRRADASPEARADAWCVASESVVLDLLGFTERRDVEPGAAVFINLAGTLTAKKLAGTRHTPCVFEHVYFARPDSFLDDVSVYKTRRRVGENLAERVREKGWPIDVVIPIPESACTAALSLAQELGLPYREGFVKNRYIGRTFIMPGQERRANSVRHKLNAIPLEFDGKNVLLVDDSIVRGTTSKQIVAMARKAGAAKVYLASCSPPLRHPCVYGIDMSTRTEFIARDKSVGEIETALGLDGLVYTELDDLVQAVMAGNDDLTETCHACFSGEYPTGDVDETMLFQIETERLGHQK
jgi:amidophosphoribosyltransferase